MSHVNDGFYLVLAEDVHERVELTRGVSDGPEFHGKTVVVFVYKGYESVSIDCGTTNNK